MKLETSYLSASVAAVRISSIDLVTNFMHLPLSLTAGMARRKTLNECRAVVH
ncbi:unnamed protein product [Amoebophrya sp. A25]|nr:unnamed protein product [Amoebophrya sp. A25]|eukprot:GSA25T00022317001.1